jgi:hypothetical protein
MFSKAATAAKTLKNAATFSKLNKALKLAESSGDFKEAVRLANMIKHTDKIDDVANVATKLGTKSDEMMTFMGMKPKT